MTIEYVTKRNGNKEAVNYDKINIAVERACSGIPDVSVSEVVLGAKLNLYEFITTSEIDRAMILSAKALIYKEPNYNYVASRLLLNYIYKEVFGISSNHENFDILYRAWFVESIENLVKEEVLDARLLDFDLDFLASQLCLVRDYKFKYIGLQTIYDRYLKKNRSRKICETPQAFFMRVSMGLALKEKNKEQFALEVYNRISEFKFMCSTPTLFNSGTTHPQMSSCFLSTLDDSCHGIMGEMHSQATMSKYAGGLGLDVTPIRGSGSAIRGTNGKSSGVIPYAKLFNDVLIGFNQAGLRDGSGCLYLEPWHIDILDFLMLRKNTGDDNRRAHNTSTAVWMNDLLMEYKRDNKDWYLFSPSDVPELHDLYGEKFKVAYEKRIDDAKRGKIKNCEVMSAKALVKEIYRQASETGHPFITFKDACNIRYPNKHVGVVHSSNLCCISGDQRVSTNKGLLTVEELYLEGTPNLVVGREKPEYASKMLLPRPNAEIIRINTENGYSHKVTPDHKVWVKDVGWVEAKDLKEGDVLLLQQYEGLWGTEENEKLAFLCGLITGDGTFGNQGNSVCIDIWEQDFYLLPEIESCVESITGNTHVFNITFPKHCNVKKARLNSTKLATLLAKEGFTRETKLRVPNFIWKGTKETVSQYLRGLFYSDGTIQAIKSNQTTISLASVNKKLLEDVQLLLMNFGIKTNLTHLRKDKTWRELPDGKGGKKLYETQPIYRLLITSIQGCKILNDNISFGEHKKNEVFLANLRKKGYRQKLYSRFIGIDKCENEDAYCLVVESEEHSWTVNGFITKNTEIIEHTKPSLYEDRWGTKVEIGETAVCTISSPNIMAHTDVNGNIDYIDLAETLRIEVRALDNALDLTFCPTIEGQNSVNQNRQIGVGLMGLQGYLHLKNISYESPEAVSISNLIEEHISYWTIYWSTQLAKERGCYPNYRGSEWSKGKFPHEMYEEHYNQRNFPTTCKVQTTLDWDFLREQLLQYGLRNGNLLAIAPTATISYICGCSQSIEPDYSVLHVYKTLSGNFTMLNELFVRELKRIGVWSRVLAEKLKVVDGDLEELEELPAYIKEVYKNVFRRNMKKLVDCAAVRQMWIDQGQSFNIYYNGNSMKEIDEIYTYCWDSLLKTTYYFRSQAASKIEKSTVCSITNPDCESCS